jgi:hypothetical protein
MVGCADESISKFLSILTNIVNEEIGLLEKDEIYFYWLNNSAFMIKKGDIVTEKISIPEISKRILLLYISTSLTVSPALIESILLNIDKVKI